MRTRSTGGDVAILETLPKNFLTRVEQYGDNKVAMRKKKYGIWQEYTWADSFRRVKPFCLGLVSLGLERGDKVCIIGDNDPEYYWAELALRVVLADETADREQLTRALGEAIRATCRVRADRIEFVPADAVSVGVKVILDERTWE